MRRLLKFLLPVFTLSAVSLPAFAQGAQPVPDEQDPPKLVWHLTVSYCYVDHCTDHDRAPNYWEPRMSFVNGIKCMQQITTMVEGQSREMARHRVLACALKSVDPGPDAPHASNKYDSPHPNYPDPELEE